MAGSSADKIMVFVFAKQKLEAKPEQHEVRPSPSLVETTRGSLEVDWTSLQSRALVCHRVPARKTR